MSAACVRALFVARCAHCEIDMPSSLCTAKSIVKPIP